MWFVIGLDIVNALAHGRHREVDNLAACLVAAPDGIPGYMGRNTNTNFYIIPEVFTNDLPSGKCRGMADMQLSPIRDATHLFPPITPDPTHFGK